MKKTMTAALVFALLLAAAGCKGNDTPAETTGTVTTTEIITTSVGEGSTPPETTVTTETTTEAKPIDPDEFLKDCVVYDVTVEECELPIKELAELEELDESERPEKVALRFTDLDGFAVIMELANETEHGYEYSLRRAVSTEINVAFDSGFLCRGGYFFVEDSGDTVIIKNNTLWAKLNKYEYHIFNGDEYYHIKNLFNDDGYVLELSADENGIRYSKTNEKYYLVNNADALLEAYESDDDFYCEYGTLSFEDGEVVYVTETIKTIGDGDFDSLLGDLYEKHDVKTIAELKAIYDCLQADEFLKDCVVYDVTVESCTWPYDKLSELEESEKPEKVALRFTDADGLVVLIQYEKNSEGYMLYFVKHIRNNSIDIPVGFNMNYHEFSFDVQYKNGTTIVSHCGDYNIFAHYYVIQDNQWYKIDNETGYTLDLSL